MMAMYGSCFKISYFSLLQIHLHILELDLRFCRNDSAVFAFWKRALKVIISRLDTEKFRFFNIREFI